MASAVPFKLPGGVYTAIVTPFTEGGNNVDFVALDALVEAQIAGGVTGIVPCGTTAESPTLTKEEKQQIIERVVSLVNKRCLVVAGTGSNNTAETVEFTKWAQSAGVDAALVVNPYYNKPNQDGLRAHMLAVAEAGLPILMYNIPGRCGVKMTAESIAFLAKASPAIVGVKEACGSVGQVIDVVALVQEECPDFAVLSGDDMLTMPMMAAGATGVVSVLSNALPAAVCDLVKAAAAGDFSAARTQHYKLLPLFKACFVDPNPTPIKKVMQLAGQLPCADVRLPLTPMQPTTEAAIVAAFKEHAGAFGMHV